MTDIFLAAPRCIAIGLLVEHHAGLFHQVEFRRCLPHYTVPNEIVVGPPVVQRSEIEFVCEELHVGTVAESCFILAHCDQLSRVAVTSDRSPHLTYPANEHVLREESIIERLQRQAIVDQVYAVATQTRRRSRYARPVALPRVVLAPSTLDSGFLATRSTRLFHGRRNSDGS